jgi:hypothetical protein
MNDQSHRQGRWAALLVASALIGAAAAHAADATSPPPAPACTAPVAATSAATDSAGGAGMLAFIDPQTGRLTSTPTAEQRAALRAALAALLNESTEGLVAVRHADGRLSMDVTGRFMHTATVNLQPSGEPSLACTNRLDDAVRHVTTPAVAVLDGLETQ